MSIKDILTERQSKVLKYLIDMKKIKKERVVESNISSGCGLTHEKCQAVLEYLEENGKVKKEKIGRGTYWRLNGN